MSRNDQRRRRALRAAAPIAGLLAAGLLVWQGSSAAFSATSTNGPDSWATGSLVLTNNGGTATYAVDTAGLFDSAGTEGNLNQGATGTKCLTVSNDGSINGSVDLAANVAGTLASNLNLTVTAIATTVDVSANCTAFPTGTATSVFSGVSTGLTTAASTNMALAANSKVAYKFAWSVGAAAPQSSSASGTFTFTIQ